MSKRIVIITTLLSLTISCGIQSNSDHRGSYIFSSAAETVDTGRYPIDHLIIVDEDGRSGLTLIYLFSGDLAGANVGVRDLRHIASQFGPPASIEFQLPLAFFTGQPIEEAGRSIGLSSGETSIGTMIQLNDDGLFQSGASRWLRSTSQGVATYFTYFESAQWSGPLNLDGFTDLAISPRFGEVSNLSAARDTSDDNTDGLVVSWETQEVSDYVTVELLQTVTDIETEVPVEVSIATSMVDASPYQASPELIAEAHEKCCWATTHSLWARLTQIGRFYSEPGGNNIMVVHRRSTLASIESADWTDHITSDAQPSYCDAYQ